MKKNLILFSALVTLLCGIMFTGCQHSIVADEATWYKTSKEVSGVDLDVWFYYSTETAKLGGTTCEPGLTIVVCPNLTSGAVGTKAYSMKTFANNTEVTVEDEESTEDSESVKIKPNGSMMDALYVYYKDDFKASAGKEPYVFAAKYTKVEKISDLAPEELKDTSWRSIVKTLINSVL